MEDLSVSYNFSFQINKFLEKKNQYTNLCEELGPTPLLPKSKD